MNLEGDRTFEAPRATVWRVLNDPAAMARTMPGVESFNVHDDRRWTANVNIPLGLGGLRMKIEMEKTEEREPEYAALTAKGTGVGAMLRMQTSFELSEASAGATAMHWTADVRIAGPVGSMGQRVLSPIVNQQVQHVLGALEREIGNEAGASSAVAGATSAVGPVAGGEIPGEASASGSGSLGSEPPSREADAPPAEGPTDYGPPADSTRDPEPPVGKSGADEGISPWSPESYDAEPDGPTTSTED
jgi:carbon monoxide dehydrogenase subunit G